MVVVITLSWCLGLESLKLCLQSNHDLAHGSLLLLDGEELCLNFQELLVTLGIIVDLRVLNRFLDLNIFLGIWFCLIWSLVERSVLRVEFKVLFLRDALLRGVRRALALDIWFLQSFEFGPWLFEIMNHVLEVQETADETKNDLSNEQREKGMEAVSVIINLGSRPNQTDNQDYKIGDWKS